MPAQADRRPTLIDIIFLVERLEALVANGRRMPMTNNVVVDQKVALDLVDQLRVAVPEEVRAAKRINTESDRILENAQTEADRIKALQSIKRGIALLDERHPQADDDGLDPEQAVEEEAPSHAQL